jgi:hypothetical protein
MNITRLAVPMAAASLGLAACGGSSDKLSKDDLAKKANAICAKTEKAGKAIAAPKDITDPAQAAAYFDKVAPLTHKETTDLQALKPADEVKDDWKAFTDAEAKADAVVQGVKTKADKKDPSGLQDLQKITGLSATVSNAAKKVGATGCA